MTQYDEQYITNQLSDFSFHKTGLDLLNNDLKNLMKGKGNFVVISGEAGIGKSALIRHFCKYSEKFNVSIKTTRFDNRSKLDPYKPFLELLKKDDRIKIEKKYSSVYDDKSTPDKVKKITSPGNIESIYKIREHISLIQQDIISSLFNDSLKKPLIIIFTDVYLASQTSWRFIHYLSEKISEQKILILTSLRQDGKEYKKEKIPSYVDILQRMNRENLIKRIQLERLNEISIRQIVKKLFIKSDFTSDFIPQVFNNSRGMPSTIIQIFKILINNRALYRQNGIWFNVENFSKILSSKVYRNSTEVLEDLNRFKAISPSQKVFLELISLLNIPFSIKLLSSVTGRTKIEVIKNIMFFIDNKIFIQITDDQFDFKRNGMQNLVRERIPADSKNRMHLKIARALDKTPYSDSSERIYRLAYHYNHSEDKFSAFKYLNEAGLLSSQNFAFPEARDYYSQALELVNQLQNKLKKSELIELNIRLALTDHILGNWDDSIRHYQDSFNLTNDEQIKTQLLIQQALSYFRLNKWTIAKQLLKQCLSREDKLTPFEKATAYYGMGNINFELGNFNLSRKYFEYALAIAEEINAKTLTANILNNYGAVENVFGKHIKAITLYSKCIPIYENLGDKFGLARVYNNIGIIYADDEKWEKANDFYGKSLSISDDMGLTPLKSINFLNRAFVLAKLDRLDEAEEYNFKALRILETLKDQVGIAEYYKIQGIIKYKKNDFQSAKHDFDMAIKLFKKLDNKLGIAEAEYERGIMALLTNQIKDVQKWLNKALSSFTELGLSKKAALIKEKLKKVG